MGQAAATTAPATGFGQLLDARHSCRAYRPDELAPAVIEAILAMAQRTASWCNSQPWQVVVTRPAATERLRAALAAATPLPEAQWDIAPPGGYHGVYRERRRACGWQLYESVGIQPGDREASARQAAQNFRLFGAPHLAVVTTDRALGPYGAIDCGAFVSNFMLAAASLGVASIAQAALASMAHVLREQLPIAPDRQVVCGISFGHADTQHPVNAFRTARAALPEVATFVDC